MLPRLAGLATVLCAIAVPATAAWAAEPALAFAKRPVASRDAAGAKIEFAAAAPADCAVYILNAQSKVVRHLAAGVLGDKAPEPLKPGLAQSLAWDGRDDLGKPAAGGPFKARVCLGLKPAFEKVIGANPGALGAVKGIACGPTGEVFVLHTFGALHPQDGSTICSVFSRDGKYLRQIVPYPANTPEEKLKGLRRLALEDGSKVPYLYGGEQRELIPGTGELISQSPVVTSDGRLVFVGLQEPPARYNNLGLIQVTTIKTAGSIPPDGLLRTVIHTNAWGASLALAPDGKTFYASDVATSKDKKKAGGGAVCKFTLEDKEAKPFIRQGLSDPRGVAVDKDGNIYVADEGAGCVAVFKPDASSLGALKVAAPIRVAVNPKTGAVYVLSGPNASLLQKFASWKEAQPVAKAEMPRYAGKFPAVLGLDASAEPPVVWVGASAGNSPWGLMRFEDKGGSFGTGEDVGKRQDKGTAGPVMDVLVDQAGQHLHVWAPGEQGTGRAFNAQTGAPESSKNVMRSHCGAMGIGLDGNYLWMTKWPDSYVSRFDSEFKALPFAAGEGGKIPNTGNPRVRARGLTSDAQGNIYTLWQTQKAEGPEQDMNSMAKFSADGKEINRRLIDSEVRMLNSPKVDYQGNIYVALGLRPGKDPFPPGLKGQVPEGKSDPEAVGKLNWYPLIYGSIAKFGPEGGKITKGGQADNCNYAFGNPADVKGAKWIFSGASNVPSWRTKGNVDVCLCESPRIDVDGLGRCFFPDAARFRVGVLDTGGNLICWFGSYGNQDSGGPTSAVPAPEIAFCWINAVAVSDENAFVGDRLNRRVVKVKLGYAAEESCAIQ